MSLKSWLRKLGIKKAVGSIVRTVLAALGGFLVAKYGLDEALVEKFVANATEVLIAVLPVVIAQLWSLVEKVKR